MRPAFSRLITAITLAGAVALAGAPQACAASAAEPEDAWKYLEAKSRTVEQERKTSGWGYIISGGVAVGVSLPGYYLSDDVFAKAIYSVGQTLGVAGVGYGAYLVLMDDEYTRFARIIRSVPELSAAERSRLSAAFIRETASAAKAARTIRAITFSLTGALNLVNAFTSSNRELKTALYFLGGINAIAAIHYAISPSEEEKVSSRFAVARFEWGPGAAEVGGSAVAMLGARWRF